MTIAALTDILAGLGTISPWFWGLFTGLVDLIAGNSLLLWSVILAMVAGTIGLVLKVVRKFGVKGRRS